MRGQGSRAPDTIIKGGYLGPDTGVGLRFGETWIAQAEVIGYDSDELFFTPGIRTHF